MVKGWGSEWFLRSNIINQIEGVGPDPWGHQSSNIQSVTSLGIKIYMVYGWGSVWFLRYKVISKIVGAGPDPWVTPRHVTVVPFNLSHHEE